MPIAKFRHAGGFAAVAALATSLTACGIAAAPVEISNPPTMAPDQTVSEACELSRAEVDAITQDVKDRIDEAGKAVAAGEAPDFDGIFDAVGGALDRVSEGVTNPEALDALNNLSTEVEKLRAIDTPDSLAGAPAYLAGLTGQLAKVQAAGEALQQLCTTG